MFRTSTHRQQRHWPRGFCPSDLQEVRLFFAPLQRNLTAGSIGNPTFTRATTATEVDQDDGTIDSSASGAARFEANGFLAEGQVENLLFPSDDFEDAAWTNSNISVTTNQTGVGGEANAAQKLTADASNSTLINDLGVNCVLVYPELRQQCVNCLTRTMGVGSSANVYRLGGPIPFQQGRPCPLCNGKGFKLVENTETVKMRVYYNPKEWVKIAMQIKVPDKMIQTILFLSDMPKVMKAKHLMPDKHLNE